MEEGAEPGLLRFPGEPTVGLEPTTCCLQNSCSAIELHRRTGVKPMMPRDSTCSIAPVGAACQGETHHSFASLPASSPIFPRLRLRAAPGAIVKGEYPESVCPVRRETGSGEQWIGTI